MIRKLLMLLLLTLAVTSVAFGASLRLDSMTTTPSVIKPGDEVDVILRIQNIVNSDEDLKYSYKLELEPSTSISENNILILDSIADIGRLGKNEYWNAKFKIKIIEGAPSSDYELNVKMKKYLESSLISTTDASIIIPVIGETFFILDSSDKTIGQGETKIFNASITNVGGASAGNVKLTLGNTEQIQILGTNTFYFNSINYDEFKNFKVTMHALDGLPSGTYNFPVTIQYNDGTQTTTQNFEAGILVGGIVDLKVASIETSPKEVRPGDNYVLITLNLQNAGEDAAKSVSAKLSSDLFDSSYSDNNLVYAGRIESSSSSQLKFYVNIPKTTSSGVYNLDLNLDYKNLLGENFNKSLSVPLYVKEKPILEIIETQSDGKAGSDIEVKVTLKNTGEENAEEVDIRLISDSSLPFSIEERSVYIGSIKPNETKTAIFNIKASSEANINTYNIRAFIRARGDSEIGDNNIYTYNKDVNINITGKAINKLALFGSIIAIAVIFAIIFRKKIKRISKKSKKNKLHFYQKLISALGYLVCNSSLIFCFLLKSLPPIVNTLIFLFSSSCKPFSLSFFSKSLSNILPITVNSSPIFSLIFSA